MESVASYAAVGDRPRECKCLCHLGLRTVECRVEASDLRQLRRPSEQGAHRRQIVLMQRRERTYFQCQPTAPSHRRELAGCTEPAVNDAVSDSSALAEPARRKAPDIDAPSYPLDAVAQDFAHNLLPCRSWRRNAARCGGLGLSAHVSASALPRRRTARTSGWRSRIENGDRIDTHATVFVRFAAAFATSTATADATRQHRVRPAREDDGYARPSTMPARRHPRGMIDFRQHVAGFEIGHD